MPEKQNHNQDARGRLLVVFGHPDDESLVGGAISLYASRGFPVTMLCATRGEAGEIAEGSGATPETLPRVREQELRDAANVLGVHDVRFLEYRDSGMEGTPENRDPRSLNMTPPDRVVAAITAVIRDARPDVIVTWDESGGYGHPDHVAVHHHTTAAFRAAGDAARHPEAGAPWTARALFYMAIPIREFRAAFEEMRRRGMELPDPPGDGENAASLPRVEPNCVIDVHDRYDQKMSALAKHVTQLGGFALFTQMPEDLRRKFFAREYFYRAQPPLAAGRVLDDLFADVR